MNPGSNRSPRQRCSPRLVTCFGEPGSRSSRSVPTTLVPLPYASVEGLAAEEAEVARRRAAALWSGSHLGDFGLSCRTGSVTSLREGYDRPRGGRTGRATRGALRARAADCLERSPGSLLQMLVGERASSRPAHGLPQLREGSMRDGVGTGGREHRRPSSSRRRGSCGAGRSAMADGYRRLVRDAASVWDGTKTIGSRANGSGPAAERRTRALGLVAFPVGSAFHG